VIDTSKLLGGPEIIPAQVNVFQSALSRIKEQQMRWRTLDGLCGGN